MIMANFLLLQQHRYKPEDEHGIDRSAKLADLCPFLDATQTLIYCSIKNSTSALTKTTLDNMRKSIVMGDNIGINA